jgi:outer membrane protein OmpA-like peptidoglycan-associated protein
MNSRGSTTQEFSPVAPQFLATYGKNVKMNSEMNPDELKEAIFDALYEYEVHKKKRRLKAVEKALRGTVMATVVGSAGFSLASSERDNPPQEMVVAMLSTQNSATETQQTQVFEGAVHFDSGQHALTETKKNQLLSVINTISKNAVVTVMGHTDAAGDNAHNHKLGMRRAQAVAGFLSDHGIKVNGVGNQLAENNKMGWSEQRVDLIINPAPATNPVDPASAPKAPPAPEINTQPESATLAKAETKPEVTPQPEAAVPSPELAKSETNAPPQTVAGLAHVEPISEVTPQPEVAASSPATVVPETKTPPQAAGLAQAEPTPELTSQPKTPARSRVAPLPDTMTDVLKPTGTAVPQQQASVADTALPAQTPSATLETQLIKGAVHFAFDKHVLTQEHQAKLLAVIKQLPQNAEISVIGRTDTIGVRAYNEQLGINRAVAVANFLKQHGVKIASVYNQFADNNQMGWRERRVDLQVNEITPAATQALAQTETSSPVPGTDNALAGKPGEAAAKQRRQVVGLVHFGFNKHTLVKAHHERLLEFLKLIPKDAQLTIVGRTDSYGTDAYNKQLGLDRAKNVANYLSHLGINVKKIGSKVAKNRSTGWQARRVDVLIESSSDINPIQLSQPVEHKRAAKAH